MFTCLPYHGYCLPCCSKNFEQAKLYHQKLKDNKILKQQQQKLKQINEAVNQISSFMNQELEVGLDDLLDLEQHHEKFYAEHYNSMNRVANIYNDCLKLDPDFLENIASDPDKINVDKFTKTAEKLNRINENYKLQISNIKHVLDAEPQKLESKVIENTVTKIRNVPRNFLVILEKEDPKMVNVTHKSDRLVKLHEEKLNQINESVNQISSFMNQTLKLEVDLDDLLDQEQNHEKFYADHYNNMNRVLNIYNACLKLDPNFTENISSDQEKNNVEKFTKAAEKFTKINENYKLQISNVKHVLEIEPQKLEFKAIENSVTRIKNVPHHFLEILDQEDPEMANVASKSDQLVKLYETCQAKRIEQSNRINKILPEVNRLYLDDNDHTRRRGS